MTSVSWFSYLPSGTSDIRDGDDDIRTNFQAIGSALSDEHYFDPAGGAADRGVHTPNASRTSFGSSAPATSALTGLLFQINSGVTQLMYAYTDAGGSITSNVVGGSLVPYVHSLDGATLPVAGQYIGMLAETGASGNQHTFTRTFNAAPLVIASIITDQADRVFATVDKVESSGCTVLATDASGTAHSNATYHLIAIGYFDAV